MASFGVTRRKRINGLTELIFCITCLYTCLIDSGVGAQDYVVARKKLAEMGVMWNDSAFTQSYAQVDGQTLSLFFDGGWKVGNGQFAGLLSGQFYDDLPAHFGKRNIIDVRSACPTPDFLIISGKYIINTTTGMGSDSLWLGVPDLYERVQKYRDSKRDLLIRNICMNDFTIGKIDDLSNKLASHRLADDGTVQRWRAVREYLTGKKASW